MTMAWSISSMSSFRRTSLRKGEWFCFRKHPLQRFDYTEAFQLGIRFGDRVAVEMKFFRQRPDGRERLARLQCARCGSSLSLVDELEIDRHAGLEIDLKPQLGSPLS